MHVRFVQTSRADVETSNTKQIGELNSEVSILQNRLNYHVTTRENSQKHIEQFLKAGGNP
jgi:TolA-binding protein